MIFWFWTLGIRTNACEFFAHYFLVLRSLLFGLPWFPSVVLMSCAISVRFCCTQILNFWKYATVVCMNRWVCRIVWMVCRKKLTICRMLSRRKRVNFVYIWRITQFLKRVFSFVELFYEVYWVFSFVELFHEDLCWKSRFPNFVDLNLKILELKQFFDVFVQNWLFWLRKTGFLVVSQQFLRMTVCFFM